MFSTNKNFMATCAGCNGKFPVHQHSISLLEANCLCKQCSPTLGGEEYIGSPVKTKPHVLPKNCSVTANDMAKVLGTNVCEVALILANQEFAGPEMAVLEKAFGPDFNPYSVAVQV